VYCGGQSALPVSPAIGPTAALRSSDHDATRSPPLAGFHSAPYTQLPQVGLDAAAARPRSAPIWSRRVVARCTPSRCPASAALRSRRSSVARSSCGVMADSCHAPSSRSMRLHLALRDTWGHCRNMRHCPLRRFELRCAKGLPAGCAARQRRVRTASDPAPQRRLFSWEAQRSGIIRLTYHSV
jgi:hypothetical protein